MVQKERSARADDLASSIPTRCSIACEPSSSRRASPARRSTISRKRRNSTTPSLYAAFGDKEQLYIHALRRYGMQVCAGLKGILGGKGRLEKRLATAYIAAIKLYTAPPLAPGCMIIGTATTEAPTHPRIAEAAKALLNETEKLLAQSFAAAIETGEMKADPGPVTRARLAGALFDALAVRARLRDPPSELEALALSIIPAICR